MLQFSANEDPIWMDDLRRAVRDNATSPRFAAFTDENRDLYSDMTPEIARVFPYRFDGRAHQIVSFERCIRRGYAACADAAAMLAAASLLIGDDEMSHVCIQSVDDVPGYAHANLTWRSKTCDPYAGQALRVRGCRAVADVPMLVNAKARNVLRFV